MRTYSAIATAHLLIRLRPLNRALRVAVEKQSRLSERLSRPDLVSLCVTEQHVQVLLDEIDRAQAPDAAAPDPHLVNPEDLLEEEELRTECLTFGKLLPFDRLSRDLCLDSFEMDALAMCAAPELNREYGRVFGYILDDLNRRSPCIELLATLKTATIQNAIERRHALDASGRLRRLGLLELVGDGPSGSLQEVRLAPGVFEFITGLETGIPALCHDAADLPVPPGARALAQFSPGEFEHVSRAIENGAVTLLGIWGPRQYGAEEIMAALGQSLDRPLRRMAVPENGPALSKAIAHQMRIASALRAIVCLDTEPLQNPAAAGTASFLADALARAGITVFLTGRYPWRPLPILRSGAYWEIELSEAGRDLRGKQWLQFLPELDSDEIQDLALRFSLSGSDIRTVADLARTRAAIAGNGTPDPVNRHVAAACASVIQRSSTNFVNVVHPRRNPEDLILPEKLHRQIVEVAAFFKLQNQVDDTWGFGRLLTGCGMKALFTGEPGTGKTLAAEVIAGLLGFPLFKIDLGRIVSKWVGETEANLEAAFDEAEECHAVLFFDEADALFGKRADVQHGTDRYANLEVSFLLQRVETSRTLVILASNVKDQIDNAFIRRFQVVIHFPKPDFDQRLRIWKMAFPPAAPLDPDVDLEALAQLDMTGAAIVTAARTSALLAADSRAESIDMRLVIRAAARQFRREARVLSPAELGPYAAMLQEVL